MKPKEIITWLNSVLPTPMTKRVENQLFININGVDLAKRLSKEEREILRSFRKTIKLKK